MPYKPSQYITGTITTVDNTLVEETINVPFMQSIVNGMLIQGVALQMLKLKSLQIELVGIAVASFMDTTADQFVVTMSPNSQATHPTINESDCMFKFARDTQVADLINQEFLIKKWALKDCYINKPQFYLQLSLASGAISVHYKIEYEIISVKPEQLVLEQSRRGYTTA